MALWKGGLSSPFRCIDSLISRSMGFIYSKAVSVIVVLQGPVWNIIRRASSSKNAIQLSPEEMEDLEIDTWISRVWTYQEMVNNNHVYFTTFDPFDGQVVVPAEPFLNCVGYSAERWKKDTAISTAEYLLRFPNLNNLEDTLLDARLSGYLERSALGIFSNMAARKYDPQYPGNRLLASLGALTQKPSWSAAATLPELAEKVMVICGAINDYSFIYTRDQRDERPGFGWRPSPDQPERNDEKPAHLNPVLNWCSYGEPMGNTQRAHRDLRGLWLDDMIRVHTSEALRPEVKERLEMWLYGGEKNLAHPEKIPSGGFLGPKEKRKSDLTSALFDAFQMMGFTGSPQCQVCESGLFFSAIRMDGRQDLEMYVASSIRWTFGAPGLALWKERDSTKYSAGVFAGELGHLMMAESMLLR